MLDSINSFNKAQQSKVQQERSFKIPKFKSGDTLAVKYKIVEGSNTRIQTFKGVVIARTKSDANYCATFTLRKVSSSVGVERKFPLYSPLITDITVLKRALVRKSKLYYLRELTGKASRLKEDINFDANQSNQKEKKSALENNESQKSDEKKLDLVDKEKELNEADNKTDAKAESDDKEQKTSDNSSNDDKSLDNEDKKES